MKSGILSIGDEVLAGRIVDANAAWIADQLSGLGAPPVTQHTVGDDIDQIAHALQSMARDVDVIVTTGGLGPTADDLTREGVAAVMQESLVVDERALDAIRAWCAQRGLPATEAREQLSCRPASASTLPNACGTAPGLHGACDGVDVWVLPGPPNEMRPMFETHVIPYIKNQMAHVRASTQEVLACGMTEADAADLLGEMLNRDRRPRLGIRVGGGLIRVAIEDCDGDLTQADVQSEVENVRGRLGEACLPQGMTSLNEAVGEALRSRGWQVVVAESCTGGGLGAALTMTAGSSAWFIGGVTTYTNQAKSSILGVPSDRFNSEGPGAVSREVAIDMAAGVLSCLGGDVAISVTGIAGPEGGCMEKPVGTVWIGLADSQGVCARRIQVLGDRDHVRAGTIQACLRWLWLHANGMEGRLPWEVRL